MKLGLLTEIEDKVDELLAVIDEDMCHMRENLSRLDQLRSLVVKREDANLNKLLETIRLNANSHTTNDSKRQSLRRQLAVALGCTFEQMTLTALETYLSAEKAEQVTQKKQELLVLAEKLKREYLKTTMLLSDCARFNRLLLDSIFNLRSTRTITYNSNGSTKRQNDTAFMNLQF